VDELLAVALRSLMQRDRWTSYQHLLDEDVFPNTQAAGIYIILRDLHDASELDVDPVVMRATIEATTEGDQRTELLRVASEIMEQELVDGEQLDVAIRRYIARGKAVKAARLVGTHINSPIFDYDVPAQLLAEAAQVAKGSRECGLNIHDAGLPGDPELERVAMAVGLSDQLDAELGGGIARGELLVILGPPGRGKTTCLWIAAAMAARAGEHVWASTLEIQPYKCVKTFYRALVHATDSELPKLRKQVKKERAALKGGMWLDDHVGHALTPSMVESRVEQLRAQGYPVSYVMIDYAGKMRPDYNRRGQRSDEALGDMIVALREVANRLNVPIITAWQVRRVGSGKFEFSADDVAECWGVVQHADIILGLNQTDQELIDRQLRLKVLKQRENDARQVFLLHSDMRRCLVRDFFSDGDDTTINFNAGTVGT